MDPFVGEIRPFSFTRVPYGWASCDGQQMQIAQNSALYSILGTTYGGNGQTTFNLPDMRNKIPLGAGSAPGLTPRDLGCTVGATSVTLSASNLPSHTHAVQVNTDNATATTAATNFPAKSVAGSGSRAAAVSSYATTMTGLASLATDTVSSAGSGNASQTRDIQQPYLPVQLCIALYGIYPSRG